MQKNPPQSADYITNSADPHKESKEPSMLPSPSLAPHKAPSPPCRDTAEVQSAAIQPCQRYCDTQHTMWAWHNWATQSLVIL